MMSNFEQISFRHSGSISGTYRRVASPKVRWLRPLPVDGAAAVLGGKCRAIITLMHLESWPLNALR